MIGGVFVLARDPRALAAWYERHLGWSLRALGEDGTSYLELYFREDAAPERRRHLVYAIMPGDPGPPSTGHIVNYRVDDIEAVVARLRAEGVETSDVATGEDADGPAKFARLSDPEGHRIELWQPLTDG